MNYYIAQDRFGNYDLAHHGIKGMKWGVRRFQNADGSLTPAGKKRYGSEEQFNARLDYKTAKKDFNKAFNSAYNKAHQAYSLSKKKRKSNDERWELAAEKADALKDARKKYGQQIVNDAYGDGRKTSAVQRNRKTKDIVMYGERGVDRIIKSMKRGKSYRRAKNIERGRAAAASILVLAGTHYIMAKTSGTGAGASTSYTVYDHSGNPIHRYR